MLISANTLCVRKAFAKRFCKVNETKVKDELTAETKGKSRENVTDKQRLVC